jgi:hypothetical protein
MTASEFLFRRHLRGLPQENHDAVLEVVQKLCAERDEAIAVANHLATGHRACSPGCDWWPRVEKVRKQ